MLTAVGVVFNRERLFLPGVGMRCSGDDSKRLQFVLRFGVPRAPINHVGNLALHTGFRPGHRLAHPAQFGVVKRLQYFGLARKDQCTGTVDNLHRYHFDAHGVRINMYESRWENGFDIPGRALLVQLPKPASSEALLQEIRAEPYPLIEKVQVNRSEIWNLLQVRAAFEDGD